MSIQDATCPTCSFPTSNGDLIHSKLLSILVLSILDPPLEITTSGLMPHQALVLVFFGTITGTDGELLNLGEVNLVKAMTLDGLKQL